MQVRWDSKWLVICLLTWLSKISDDTKERLNRLVIGVATKAVDNFRKRGSRLSSPADLYGSRFCSSFRTSAIWIWVKEKLRRLGQVAAGVAELLPGVGVSQEGSMASRGKMLIEMIIYRGFIGGDSVSYPQCSGQLGGGALVLHGFNSVPKLFAVRATGCKSLFEKGSLCFPN